MGRGCEDQDGAEDQEDDDDDDDEWNPVCQGAAVGHDENGHAKDVANNDAEEDEEEVRTQTHVGCTFLSFPLGLVYVNGLCFIHILVIFFQKLKTAHVVAFFQPSTHWLSSRCQIQDSDSDWAPEVQGAANVEKSEKEALKVLLQPNFVKEKSPESPGANGNLFETTNCFLGFLR
jgi:hypothetical protein